MSVKNDLSKKIDKKEKRQQRNDQPLEITYAVPKTKKKHENCAKCTHFENEAESALLAYIEIGIGHLLCAMSVWRCNSSFHYNCVWIVRPYHKLATFHNVANNNDSQSKIFFIIASSSLSLHIKSNSTRKQKSNQTLFMIFRKFNLLAKVIQRQHTIYEC